jgi:hypothetical protein
MIILGYENEYRIGCLIEAAIDNDPLPAA